ncbi:MAG TPA: helix-turn-helix domain-containing protein [Candidatus Latescibacteria bacterium]|nr:helix-turn-helix domain-containing protein [Candidatus Latescibacterota bacterium]HJP34208.1 helix-turn-helix domain-containing protein [Candidatus Latescibacterota bacterium]
MTDLEDILKRPEGKTLEFKRDLSSPDGVLKTIVAFANTAGGTLLLGIEDGSRHVRGVTDALDMEERLANLVSDRIHPRLVPEIDILPWRRTHVLAVHVHPSPSRPHHFTREEPERGTYVRVGSTNRRADAELLDELRRFARGEGYDEQPMPELDSEAIDFRVASESFLPVRKLARRDLATWRLVTDHQGRKVPTVGGMILFGTDRERHFPDAWIQVGRFQGADKSRIVDRAEIRSLPVPAVEEAIAFVQKHALHGAEIGPVRRKERWSLPPVAVREALINAVAHTDYAQRGAPLRLSIFDDRLEIENPGLLPFGLTLEDLPRGVSKLRNRVIGRVFHALGLIEQWGSGIQRMTAACHEAGLAAPLFEELATRFRVTLHTAQVDRPSLDDTDQSIVACLESGEGRSTSEIAKKISLTPRATRTRLARMVGSGLVREIGTGPQDPKRRYYLAEQPPPESL